jgi:hypothetical protein
MAKMEAEWNAIGEDDEDRDESSGGDAREEEEDDDDDDDEEEDDDEDEDEDEEEDDDAEEDAAKAEKKAAKKKEAEKKAAKKAAETREVDDDDDDSAATSSSSSFSSSSETAGLSRSVGVDARAASRELDDLDATGQSRNARNVATGGFAVISTLACFFLIAHAKRSIENARPHSSIELGSSSFKRDSASTRGVPIKYARLGVSGGGDGDREREAKRASSAGGSKKTKKYEKSVPVLGPPGAAPGLDLGRGGTALFGDSGSGRRGKKSSRKTTREEDDFYS